MRRASKNARRACAWISTLGARAASSVDPEVPIANGTALGADSSPSRSATTSSPAAAPSGTRTSARVRLRRSGAAVTSSALSAAPRKRTSNARPR